jgi:hypothetical protein
VCVCRSLTNGFKEWNKKAAHIFEYKGIHVYYYIHKQKKNKKIIVSCYTQNLKPVLQHQKSKQNEKTKDNKKRTKENIFLTLV